MEIETSSNDGPESSGPLTQGVRETGAGVNDILVESVAAGDPSRGADFARTAQDLETLNLQDVLRSDLACTHGEAVGVFLSFETIGNDTVISVEANGANVMASIATLEGVTGITLQQLLSANYVVT